MYNQPSDNRIGLPTHHLSAHLRLPCLVYMSHASAATACATVTGRAVTATVSVGYDSDGEAKPDYCRTTHPTLGRLEWRLPLRLLPRTSINLVDR